MSFTFSDSEVQVLKNFARISPTQIIKPNGFGAKETKNTIAGVYKFEDEKEFEEFGIYQVPEFLAALDALQSPELVHDSAKKLITMKDGDSKIRFTTTPLDMIRETAEVNDLGAKWGKLPIDLAFELTADKLATIHKTASVLKAKFLYFERYEDAIRITVAQDKLESSANSFQVVIRDGINTLEITDEVFRIPLAELRIVPGDFNIEFSGKVKVSNWKSSVSGIDYYIGFAKD